MDREFLKETLDFFYQEINNKKNFCKNYNILDCDHLGDTV